LRRWRCCRSKWLSSAAPRAIRAVVIADIALGVAVVALVAVFGTLDPA